MPPSIGKRLKRNSSGITWNFMASGTNHVIVSMRGKFHASQNARLLSLALSGNVTLTRNPLTCNDLESYSAVPDQAHAQTDCPNCRN